MNDQQLKSVVEGLLFAAGDEGLGVRQLAEVIERPIPLVYEIIDRLRDDYEREERGMQLIEIAGAYQLTTKPEHAPYFERLAESPSRASLSQAALETLAIVAYRQPITRVEIEEIRGVKSDRALHTLMLKGLVREMGRAEAVGRPFLYGTTEAFLDYFGLNALGDLPNTAEFDHAESLEEETRLLFEKLESGQMTIEEIKDV